MIALPSNADRVLSPPAVAIEDLDVLHVLARNEFAVIRQAARETEILAEASVGYDLGVARVRDAIHLLTRCGDSVVGHTDYRGDGDYNQALSDLRAASVLEAVLDVNVSLMGRVSATGRGEREPLVAGDSEADQRVNRRVEVLVVCDG